jgi:DNA-binding HxlR family transcriptional regulator
MADPSPEQKHTECPIEATVSMIGGKWKTVVLWKLRDDKLRFNQLMAEMPEISPKMLTKQLRELELDGLVARKMYPEIPPRVEYSLTPKGVSLVPILVDMAKWGVANIQGRSWMGCPTKCRCNLKDELRG